MTLTSSQPRTLSLRSLSPHGFHRVVYYEWGDAGNPRVVICVHGVGRNGRDFDVLGEALAPTHRVLAVDMPGPRQVRLAGRSERLRLPDVPHHADGADRAQRRRRRRLGRHVDGRAAGHRRGRAARNRRSAPGRQRRRAADRTRRAGAHRRVLRPGSRRSPRLPRSRPTSATISAPFGPLTDAQWDHMTRTNVAPARRRTLGPRLRSRHRRAVPQGRRRRRTCGRCGTPSAARRWCCAARTPTCCRRTWRERWRRAARSPGSSSSRASDTRRCC